MAAVAEAVVTAASLPQRLMHFFAKYPPKQYSAYYTGVSIPIIRRTRTEKQSENAQITVDASADPSIAPTVPSEDVDSSRPEVSATIPPTADTIATTLRNPFMPWKNPKTGHWQGPKYGLRRQADLVKLAKKYGVEPLLPPGRKSTAFKEQRALERGLRVKGTGEGEVVKGHKWERSIDATVEKRVKAMEEMPALIREWKQVR